MRLKGHRTNGGCPRRRGPRIDYVCCDYDYNRCEIDLFTKLERHKEATNALESLLHSKECVQESGIVDCINNDLLWVLANVIYVLQTVPSYQICTYFCCLCCVAIVLYVQSGSWHSYFKLHVRWRRCTYGLILNVAELMRVSWDNCQLQVQQKLAASFSSGQMKYGHVVLLKWDVNPHCAGQSRMSSHLWELILML